MTALSFTAKQISADPANGAVLRNHEAAAALAVGVGVALNSSGKLVKSDANGSSTAQFYGIVVAPVNQYGETTIASGERCTVCIWGPVFGWTGLAEGTVGWVSETAGEIDDTKPASAAYQFGAGYAIEEDVFFVHPGINTPVSV